MIRNLASFLRHRSKPGRCRSTRRYNVVNDRKLSDYQLPLTGQTARCWASAVNCDGLHFDKHHNTCWA